MKVQVFMSRLHQAIKVAARYAEKMAACPCDSSEEQIAVAPPGWEAPVKEMKKDPEIDNPFALAWWHKNQGHKPHKQ